LSLEAENGSALTISVEPSLQIRACELEPAPLADDAALDIGLGERALVTFVFRVVRRNAHAHRIAMRQRLHAFHDEAEPVPYDEHAGRCAVFDAETARRGALDAGEGEELTRLNALGAKDRHEALGEIQGQERL